MKAIEAFEEALGYFCKLKIGEIDWMTNRSDLRNENFNMEEYVSTLNYD